MTRIFTLIAVLAAVTLSACSGGGGGGTSKSVTSQTVSFSSNGVTKTTTTSYSDGSSSSASLTGSIDSVQWANDHITKTTIYRFTDGTTNPFVETIGPTLTAPMLTGVNYPSHWSSGTSTGTVTKPVTSPKQDVFGDGYKYIYEDGTVTKPFQQSTLTPIGAIASGAINDPNAYVTAPTKGTYDLRWGEPDPAGPAYAANFIGDKNYTLSASKKIFNGVLSGGGVACMVATANDVNCGATLPAPSPEVIDAWNQGWTGSGKNILIWDDISDTAASEHPVSVETIAQRYAWGSTFYGMSYQTTIPNVLTLDGGIYNDIPNISINIVNMSYGADLSGFFIKNPTYTPFSQTGLLAARNSYQLSYSNRATLLTNTNYKGLSNLAGGFDLSDAVLVKAAGNDNIDAEYEPLNYWISQNSNDVMRLLIVGALNDIGQVGARAYIASYSNKAGTDPTIQSRFLVESGKSVFSFALSDYYNGQQLLSGDGTSYAAPRVAGYAAIVRQKFPNLTGANTADILLTTARYDTLTCYQGSSAGPTGGCDKAIYGQGEASLSRALAPVGYLR